MKNNELPADLLPRAISPQQRLSHLFAGDHRTDGSSTRHFLKNNTRFLEALPIGSIN